MASEKKVINIFMIILTFLFYCNSTSSETKKYTNLEILYEDPLVFETLEFTREFFKQSEYIENDKEICYFLSSNWKYESHNIFIEYIFATKNYLTKKINLYKIIIHHDEKKFKSYKHDIEGAWNVILFEKMKPDSLILTNDERFLDVKKLIDIHINKGKKYKIEKINDLVYFEKINQIRESNAYICSVALSLINTIQTNYNYEEIINEEFLIEEDVNSGKKSLRYVIYRNPNL